MDNRRRARELWEQSGGTLPLKEIAAQLGVAEGTLRSWKKRDAWGSSRCNVAESATQRETQRKRRAQVNRRAAETVEANDALTDREKDFCAAFVHAPSAAQAAMKTGRYSTYGAARTAAWEMMRKETVREEIKRLKSLKRAAMLADGDDIVEMHMRIAFADISDFVEFGREEVPVMGPFGPLEIKVEESSEMIPVTKIVNTVRFREHAQVDGTVISEVKQSRDGASVKLADRQKSLAFLERYFELNPMDKHKKAFDKARLKLEERQVKVQEDKLHGMSSDVETIKEGLQGIIDVINSPVPDRRLDDE